MPLGTESQLLQIVASYRERVLRAEGPIDKKLALEIADLLIVVTNSFLNASTLLASLEKGIRLPERSDRGRK